MDDRALTPQASLFSRMSRAQRWLWLFLVYNLIGFWNLGVRVTDNLASRKPAEFPWRFMDEMTGAYCAYALLPFVLWFFRSFPLRRKNLATHLPLYLLTGFIYAAVQMALMAATRTVLYPLIGLGRFDYGLIVFRFLMESLKLQLVFWIAYGIVSLFRIGREREEQRVQASRLEEQLVRARLQNLQAQLNPHFLFNTLNTISSTMYESVEAADRMIAALSDLLRATLASGGPVEQSLEKELEIVRLYIEIMKARFGGRLVVAFDLAAGAGRALVPTFLLQPLIENAIKHGQVEGRTTVVEVRAGLAGRRLRLIVQDNGPGLGGDPQLALKAGVGLSNTVERLERLYGRDQEFSLRDREEGGLMVVIEVPHREAGAPGSDSTALTGSGTGVG